jgi:hypothetical protein
MVMMTAAGCKVINIAIASLLNDVLRLKVTAMLVQSDSLSGSTSVLKYLQPTYLCEISHNNAILEVSSKEMILLPQSAFKGCSRFTVLD